MLLKSPSLNLINMAINVDRIDIELNMYKTISFENIIPYLNLDKITLKEIEILIEKFENSKREKVLNLANKEFFSAGILNSEITKSIITTGKKNMRNILILNEFDECIKNTESGQNLKILFKNSFSIAILASMISKRIFKRVASDYFLIGFFHNLHYYFYHELLPIKFNVPPETFKKEIKAKYTNISNNFLQEILNVIEFKEPSNLQSFSGIIRISIYLGYLIWQDKVDDSMEWVLDDNLKKFLIENKEDFKIILMD
ncbi:MAG: HDOD domain-containing protein, partial [Leptospiraceae bacterium]|nr:HDOD domain-containing protein [Leptospiraceae bacterium]